MKKVLVCGAGGFIGGDLIAALRRQGGVTLHAVDHKPLCMLSVLINTHLLRAAPEFGVQRFFFASSACVDDADKQRDPNVTVLKEADSYPARPEDGYGWENFSASVGAGISAKTSVSRTASRATTVFTGRSGSTRRW